MPPPSSGGSFASLPQISHLEEEVLVHQQLVGTVGHQDR